MNTCDSQSTSVRDRTRPAVPTVAFPGSSAAGTRDVRHHRRAGSRRRMGGFTLVEVLVAVLVISIGMLGVAKLILDAVKANDSAYFRTQAADLAYSILDAMRANRAAALTSPGYTVQTASLTNPGFTCRGAGNTCTPNQVVQYDLYEWKKALNSSLGGALPSGEGTIAMTFPSGAGTLPTATITITWDDSLAQWAFGTAPATTTPVLGSFTLESAL